MTADAPAVNRGQASTCSVFENCYPGFTDEYITFVKKLTEHPHTLACRIYNQHQAVSRRTLKVSLIIIIYGMCLIIIIIMKERLKSTTTKTQGSIVVWGVRGVSESLKQSW